MPFSLTRLAEYLIRLVDPHPAIVTIRDNREYIRVLLYSYYTTTTGWGGPPNIYGEQGLCVHCLVGQGTWFVRVGRTFGAVQ